MSNEPHVQILDREKFPQIINDNFSDSLNLIKELVNYGTNLIPRSFVSSERKNCDIVIVVNFLKQAVTLLDSIQILLSQGAMIPCFILLRSLFEVDVYLEWIFKAEMEYRASLYFVWEQRSKLHWMLCLKEGTEENKIHKLHMGEEHIQDIFNAVELEKMGKNIEGTRAQLSSQKFASVNEKFELKGMRLNDGPWYKPTGVNNLREMAKSLNREGEYKVFYSLYSNLTHGLAFDNHVGVTDEGIVMEPIRDMKRIHEVLTMSCILSNRIYRNTLTHYRPGELSGYALKYVNEWWNRFAAIKSVEYKDGTYTIKPSDRHGRIPSVNFPPSSP